MEGTYQQQASTNSADQGAVKNLTDEQCNSSRAYDTTTIASYGTIEESRTSTTDTAHVIIRRSNSPCRKESTIEKNSESEEMESREPRLKDIEHAVRIILKALQANISPSIYNETPSRYASALLELTDGYHSDPKEIAMGALYPAQASGQFVFVRSVKFESMCEHHMLPFFGSCNIIYITKKNILGLSKFSRIVQALSHRLQVQERLCNDIVNVITEILDPEGVLVHMTARGAKDSDSSTTTVSSTGILKDDLSLRSFALSELLRI